MLKINREQSVFQMSPKNKAVASAKSGDTVIFETFDCFSNKIKGEEQLFSSIGWDCINPATGPLYVDGAEPGDALKVTVLDISLAEHGVMITAPGFGALGDEIKAESTKVIPIKDGKAIFNERISLPLNPMIGVIGTAPADEDIPTGTPGKHGGNMDCKRIVKGSSLYLPVNIPGALLALGDLHALMGDGEIVVCGVEISGEVTVKVEVLKNCKLPLPMLTEGEHVITIASAETLDEAAREATKNMFDFLLGALGLGIDETGMLLSAVGDLRICQIVDPLMTARMEFPLWILKKYDYPVNLCR